MNTKGQQVGVFYLQNGYGGLVNKVPQAEGITLDCEGRLYICSEPNLLYIFDKQNIPLVSQNLSENNHIR